MELTHLMSKFMQSFYHQPVLVYHAFLLLKQSYFPWFVLAGQHQELFLELILGEKKPSRYVAARVLTLNCICDNLNKLTLLGTRGVWMPSPPPSHKVFLSFFLEDKTSVPEVFSSCSFIPPAHFVSVAMVTRYDVTSSSWSSQFWVKIHVFSTSFKNNSKSCG